MKIAIITISRADWSALGEVAKAFKAAGHEVSIDSWAGEHIAAIKADGFIATFRPFGNMYAAMDAVIVLGDRLNALHAAAGVVSQGGILVHLSAGDTTAGSDDDSFRHAISKLAHILFAHSDQAVRKLLSIGEDRGRIFRISSPAVDRVERIRALNLPRDNTILVNYQPATREPENGVPGLHHLLSALSKHGFGPNVVLMDANDDPGGATMNAAMREWAAAVGAWMPGNLVPDEYLRLVATCSWMVGNSSSLLYEAPILGTRSILIGTRQYGRMPLLPGQFLIGGNADIMDSIIGRTKFDGFPPIPHRAYYPFGQPGGSVEIVTMVEHAISTMGREKLRSKA